MNIDFVFKIAGIGIIITLIGQILTRAGREDIAMLTTLSGLVIVLMMVASMVSDFFTSLRSLFMV